MKTLPMEISPNYSPMDIRYDRNRGFGAGYDIGGPSTPPSTPPGLAFETSSSAIELGGASPPDYPDSPGMAGTKAHPDLYPQEGAPPPVTETGTFASQEPFETPLEGAPPGDPAGMAGSSLLSSGAEESPFPGMPPSDVGQISDDAPPPISVLAEMAGMDDTFAALGEAAPPPASQLQEVFSHSSTPPETEAAVAEAPQKPTETAPKRSRRTASRSSKGGGSRASKSK